MDILVLTGSRYGDPPAMLQFGLYKNNRDGTFSDVTARSGLFRTGYWYVSRLATTTTTASKICS